MPCEDNKWSTNCAVVCTNQQSSSPNHHEDIFSYFEGFRAPDPRRLQTLEVPHFLLSTEPHHFPGVMAAVPTSKPKLSGDVSITIVEYKDGGLVDLDCQVSRLWSQRMMNVRLGSFNKCGWWEIIISIPTYATINLLDQTPTDHFEENDPRPGIKHLPGSCTICLVLLACCSTWSLAVYPDPQIWVFDVCDSRRIFGEAGKLIREPSSGISF